MKKIFILIPLLISFIACTDNTDIYLGYQEPIDDAPTPTNCEGLEYVDQDAQGTFFGTNFTYQKAYYISSQVGNNSQHIFTILINNPIGGTCDFPEYEEGSTNQTIFFSLSSLETQTVSFQSPTTTPLTFNNIAEDNTPSIELAACGTFELVNYNTETKQVNGKITTKSNEGSIINGNITFELCESE